MKTIKYVSIKYKIYNFQNFNMHTAVKLKIFFIDFVVIFKVLLLTQ